MTGRESQHRPPRRALPLLSTLALAGATLVGPLQAQQTARSMRMPTALRDAGTYHVATGKWTRGGNAANLGPDTIYSATAPSGYFGTGWEGSEGVDEGILPSTGNPIGGPQDCYTIDGFEFAYCSTADVISWSFNFYDSYVPCDLPDNPANCLNVVGGVSIGGLPTVSACWIVAVDLTGGYEFGMQADGGTCAPGYQGAASGLDHFGWGATWVTGNGGASGPLISGGDPNWAPEGQGTCYSPGLTCGAGATGLGAQDLFAVTAPISACFWFGGYNNPNGCGGPSVVPSAQFHLELYTDCSVPCSGNPDLTLFEYTGGAMPPEMTIVGGDPANVQFGVPLSIMFDANSPLDGTMADNPGGGDHTFPGPDDPNTTGMLLRLNGAAVDPLANAAVEIDLCIKVQWPGPPYDYIECKIVRAAGWQIDDKAKKVIAQGGRANWWKRIRALKKTVGDKGPDSPEGKKAQAALLKIQKKGKDYDVLVDGSSYMPETTEMTRKTLIVNPCGASEMEFYLTYRGEFSALFDFISLLRITVSDNPGPNPAPGKVNICDDDMIIDQADDYGPGPENQANGPAGGACFPSPVIDLATPSMRSNRFDAVWIGNDTALETLTVQVPGQFPLIIPPDSEVAVPFMTDGGLVTASGSLGSFCQFTVLPSGRVGRVVCTAAPNSASSGAEINAFGSTVLSNNDLTLNVDWLPLNQFGFFLMSQGETYIPVSQGILCLAPPIFRFQSNVLNSGASGSVELQDVLQKLPGGVTLTPGDTWSFQYWTRDGNAANFSDTVRVTFE
jgi:hypothetical protein